MAETTHSEPPSSILLEVPTAAKENSWAEPTNPLPSVNALSSDAFENLTTSGTVKPRYNEPRYNEIPAITN